ncbi:MAG TPA: hypothetical protein VNS19_23580 [Acidimicrobiales bacterium]|nr:hypothetical protein [Acidimicrobiales bacterium]
MSAVGGPDEQRFEFRSGTRGGKNQAVVVERASARIEHPLLKEDLVVPLAVIGRAVHLTVIEDDATVYRGAPRGLRLVAAAVDANVVLVLDRPVRIARFKLGAPEQLGITAKERRKGASVDVLFLRVDDPAGLVSALGEHGVASDASLAAAMGAVYGAAPEAEAAAIRSHGAARARRARIKLVVAALALVVLGSARMHEEDEGGQMLDHVIRQTLVAYLVVAVIVVAAFRVPLRRKAGPGPRAVGEVPSTTRSVAAALVPLAVLGGLLALGLLLRRVIGVSSFLAYAPFLGIPAGALLWFLIRSWRREREATDGPRDGGPEPDPRLPSTGVGVPPSPYRR